ncbi:MAG: hypothetical protein QF535_21215, partial [Anaerolineales bacterium]|nr:hypothetical protein [Anaerolineales bacterium]
MNHNLIVKLIKSFIVFFISFTLFGCGGGGGSTSSNIVSTTPKVTLSSSASSIYESASGTLTITATLSSSVSENVTVTIGTSGTSTEGTDYSNVSDITITAENTTGTATFDPTSDTTYENSNETAILSITGVSGGGATESGNQLV